MKASKMTRPPSRGVRPLVLLLGFSALLLRVQGLLNAQPCRLYPIALSAQSLANAAPGAVLPEICNGAQPGNFGWLSWAGAPSEPALVSSLTPPGDSSTYLNPDDPLDHEVSVGDWVAGAPGVANSKQVRAALIALEPVEITVPVWDRVRGTGAHAAYHVSAFARVRLMACRLPGQNRLTARFLGYATCGSRNLPPNNAGFSVSAGPDQTIYSVEQALLQGMITDKRIPAPGPPAAQWTQVSGPGQAAFTFPTNPVTRVSFSQPGTYVLRLMVEAVVADDVSVTVMPWVIPPDPVSIAPTLDRSVASTVGAMAAFLYAGTNAVQIGVRPDTIAPARAAVVRGRVLTAGGSAFPGVVVTVPGHPELGRTLTRADGRFDLAVNGGGTLVIRFSQAGFQTVQRQTTVPQQDFDVLPDVVMTSCDSRVTLVDLTATGPLQVARANAVTDKDGTRQATVLFPAGNKATMILPEGIETPLTALSVRATEFTVGTNGPAAMPADLPPSSGYTYCVELNSDEAVAAGATTVRFSQPVSFYVENFLGFPVGGAVPAAYYDRQRGVWVPSADGRVISILSVINGQAQLDLDGRGSPADATALAALGITPAECSQLATLYQPGQTLWRVTLTHFTPWDFNWPYGPPADAAAPAQPRPTSGRPENDPCKGSGSIIELQNQTLRQTVALVGTPFAITYASDRTPGWRAGRTLTIPLSGSTVPASLKRIDLLLSLLGRTERLTFAPAPNLTTTCLWDGRDAYGRLVQGQQPVTIQIGYVYDALYQQPAQFAQSFAALSGTPIRRFVTGPAREITLWQTSRQTVGGWDARAQGLAGWSLNVHHAYDPKGATLYLGSGDRRGAATGNELVIETVTGNGDYGFGGDGGPATQAQLASPNGLAVGPDGTLYIADQWNSRVRRVSLDGTITTVAGNGDYGFSGDGGPATAAALNAPSSVAVGPDGSLFIADQNNFRIRRVDANGIITTIAGNGAWYSSGDGGSATNAGLVTLIVKAAADGGVYVLGREFDYANNTFLATDRLRRIGTDGCIQTVFKTSYQWQTIGFSGDGGPFNAAQTGPIFDFDVAPDGSLFLADTWNNRVRRIGPNGIITTIAGDGNYGYNGDGSQATQTPLTPVAVAAGPDGSVFLADYFNNRIRRVTPDGIITTVAGDGDYGNSGDGGLATQARIGFGYSSLAVGPHGAVYFCTYGDNTVRRFQPPWPGFSNQTIAIASDDGSELFVFDPTGRHLRTLDALTGAVRYQFNYTTAGWLDCIVDTDGNTTSVERDANGNPTAIVGPFGARTRLSLDPAGNLGSLTDPAGQTIQFACAADGLMQTLTDPRQHTHQFAFDSFGRLLQDTDPAGGFTRLNRAQLPDGYQVTKTTALGRLATYRVQNLPLGGQRRINTGTDGTSTTNRIAANGLTATWSPDGSTSTVLEGPDPRWGVLAPLPTSLTHRLPSGLASVISFTRTVGLADAANPLSLTNQTDMLTLNGQPFVSTYTFDGTNRFVATASPLGRTTTALLDERGRVLQAAIPTVAPVNFQYDPHGRLTTVSQTAPGQSRSVTYTYDSTENGGPASGRLIAITDALERTTTFTYDPNLSGHIIQQTFSNGRFVGFEYDANGNLTGVTPPQQPTHLFQFNRVDLQNQYNPPLAADTGNNATSYEYNLDRQLTRLTRPDGWQINYLYDPAIGRLAYMLLPANEQISFLYHGPDCGCSGVGRPSDVTFAAADYTSAIHCDYDGSLVTGVTWTGPLGGRVNAAYDNFFRVSSLSVNGANPVSFRYDADGLLVQAGSLTLARDPNNGRLIGTAVGIINDQWTYDSFGQAQSYAAYAGNALAYFASFTRDNAGRIINKVEIIGDATNTFAYAYEPARGWLTDVISNGVAVAHYDYDDNGNRTNAVTADRQVAYAPADGQDRMLSATETLPMQMPENVTWTYSANGEWQSRTFGGSTTTYAYDARGSLRGVGLPDGTQVEYVIDPAGRRVGKRLNGVLVQGWLYRDALKPVAELDGNGTVVSRFVYGGKANVPEYMTKGGTTYRLITDQLSSVRLVVEAAGGAIAQRLDYDEFGRVLLDTNPGFQPFGFAGGLYDPLTRLVHFGARDYDPDTGRWSGKDVIGFAGGDPNLYAYVRNDPINVFDPFGLWSFYRWLYTGNGNAIDEVYEAATEAAGDYLYVSGGVRGGYIGVGIGGKTGGTGSLGWKAGLTGQWTIEEGASASTAVGLGLRERGRNSLGQFTSQTIGVGGGYTFVSQQAGLQDACAGAKFSGIYGGTKTQGGGSSFGFANEDTFTLGLNYGAIGGGLIIDPNRVLLNFRDSLQVLFH